jgi:hypothetical protein
MEQIDHELLKLYCKVSYNQQHLKNHLLLMDLKKKIHNELIFLLFQLYPSLVVTKITPLAPLAPYSDVAVASFIIEKELRCQVQFLQDQKL